MIKKFLINRLKMDRYNNVDIFQDKKQVRTNGNFSLPSVLADFKTQEEAQAYIKGIKWAIKYYGGWVFEITKDIECEYENLPIYDLDLSVHAYNCCIRGGYHYLSDLEGKTKNDLMQIRTLGKKTMEEIINKCKKYGIVIK